MMVRGILAAALVLAVSSTAFAESGSLDQQNACRPDVRRFCHKLKESDGDAAFVECLNAHLAMLSKPCRAVLQGNGN
jgi:uncharacterized protein